MRSKIAVLGEKDSVLGFKAVGFDVFEFTTSQRAQALVDRLAKENYGIIFITEETLSKIPRIMDAYKTAMTPAIIPIPGKGGTMGIGMANLSSSVERAVGADILFKD